MNYTTPATLLCDFYKVSHKNLYPKGTEVIYSTFTPRSNKYFPIADKVVVFGIQAFIKKYLVNYFNDFFFYRPRAAVTFEYERYIRNTLGEQYVDSSHIESLHKLGYLPIRISALKEGTLAPIKTPVLTVENTHPEFFWLTNYIETLISTEIWQPMTSATISYQYRKLLNEYAIKTTGSTDGVAFQGHDFSMRGMSSLESAMSSGAGHLLSFNGTDTIPAIAFLEKYYKANVEKELVGTSIPATEHSIMSAGTPADGDRDEYETFKRIITEVYPTGFVSIVSDTYDFWKNITETLPKLKDIIMNRDGRVVIRPDSGYPVDILCGAYNPDPEAPESKGLIECLWDIFGGTVTEQGYKVLDPHIGAIYGDSITLERAERICKRLKQKGFASTNVVYGIGSYTFQYNTRDTFGFAMKATYAKINGEEVMLFKDPKTDDGTKRSQKGRVVVLKNPIDGKLDYIDGLNKDDTDFYRAADLLQPVFENGNLLINQSLTEIRERLTTQQ